MKRSAKYVAAIAVIAISSGVAHAAAFDFTFGGNTVTGPLGVGSFVFSGTGSGNATGSVDPFQVTALSGTLFASGTNLSTSITGVSSVLGADDKISFSSPYVVDTHGVSFSTATLGDFNIRLVGSSVEIFSSLAGGFQVGTITSGSITARTVAVPGPIAGAGLVPILGLAGAWFMRRRKQLAA